MSNNDECSACGLSKDAKDYKKITKGMSSKEIFLEFNRGNLSAHINLIAEGIYYDVMQQYLMLSDSNRMLSYQNGIFNDDAVKDKVIVDAGSGYGILSLWCAKAGAKKVYAIEITDNYKTIIEAAKNNGVSDIVEVIHGDALKVEIPEKIDCIITEPLGSAIICEGMFHFIISLREKFLKQGGQILPGGGDLFISAVADPDFYGRMESFFKNFKAVYGIKMDHLLPRVYEDLSSRAFMKTTRKEFMKSEPAKFKSLDFLTMTNEEADVCKGDFTLEIVSDGEVNGFSIWFDVHFPNKSLLATGPKSQPTHWKTVVVYFDKTKYMKAGQKITGTAICSVIQTAPAMLNTKVNFQVDDGPIEKLNADLGLDRGQLILPMGYQADVN